MKDKIKILPGSALVVLIVDLTIIFLSGFGSAIFRFGFNFPDDIEYLWLVIISVNLYFVTAVFSGVYQSWKGVSLYDLCSL